MTSCSWCGRELGPGETRWIDQVSNPVVAYPFCPRWSGCWWRTLAGLFTGRGVL